MFGLGRIEGSLFGLSRGYSVGYAIAFKRMRWAGDWRRIKDVFIYVLSCNGASLVPQTVKNLPAMWGTLVLSPGEGNGNPLPYSCLKNSMDRGAWWATIELTQLVLHGARFWRAVTEGVKYLQRVAVDGVTSWRIQGYKCWACILYALCLFTFFSNNLFLW